jgi:hypothetical protein
MEPKVAQNSFNPIVKAYYNKNYLKNKVIIFEIR